MVIFTKSGNVPPVPGFPLGARRAGRVGQLYPRFAGNTSEGLRPFYGFPLGNAFKGGGGIEVGGSKIFAEADCLDVLISAILSLALSR